MSVAAVVPAAGSGQRFRSAAPKALHVLAGASLLLRSARMLSGVVDQIVVAAPAAYRDAVGAQLSGLDCLIVDGGAERQDSVAAALAALAPEVDLVLVHDAARPLMPSSVAHAVLAALRAGAFAVVPVLPVADTLKTLAADRRVGGTVDRSRLVAVQTPQGFRRDVLEQAHRSGRDVHTDDAGLVEALGVPVDTVPGHPAGFKITTPYDVVLAEALLSHGEGRA